MKTVPRGSSPRPSMRIACALAISGLVSFCVARADEALANSARNAASSIHDKFHGDSGFLWFQGHWGFQYYMEKVGAEAIDFKRSRIIPGDMVVVPTNNCYFYPMYWDRFRKLPTIEAASSSWLTTVHGSLSAGFYSDGYGSLPFAAGPVPVEKYYVMTVPTGYAD